MSGRAYSPAPARGAASGWLIPALGVAALLVLPAAIYPVFLMKLMLFGLFASAFNLLLGFGGLLSFGHAAYFGMASYVSAYTALRYGWPPELSVLAGVATAAAMGLAFGSLAIRRSGIYFAMITLAFAQMVYFICVQAPFTGGEDGIQAVPRGLLFGVIDLEDRTALYLVVTAVFLFGMCAIHRIVHSPFGETLQAIRDNEARAISLGYRVQRYKLAMFVLSASLAGLAGAMKPLVFRLASLTDVHFAMSGEVVLMTLLGGIGTMFGPLLGAAIVLAMEDFLSGIGSWLMVVKGAIFVLCVLAFRDGLVGLFERIGGRLRR